MNQGRTGILACPALRIVGGANQIFSIRHFPFVICHWKNRATSVAHGISGAEVSAPKESLAGDDK